MNRLIPAIIVLSFAVTAFAQSPSISREVIAAGGDYFTSPVGSLSWTLGEPVVETVVNGGINIVLTQGFQQPDELDSIPIGIFTPTASNNVFVSMYPNPVAHSIRLDVKYDDNSRIRIELIDLLGRVLNSDELDVQKNLISNYQIDVSTLASGMYIFRLTDKGQLLNSYKFQKVSN